MTTPVYIYITYTIISLAMTVWVARTLHRNGRVFLLEAFGNREEMADSVNRLLVVGFYLVNLGFILLFLRFGTKPETVIDGIEYAATKLGVVMLVLGAMHFFNIYNFDRIRKKGTGRSAPKVAPGVPPVLSA